MTVGKHENQQAATVTVRGHCCCCRCFSLRHTVSTKRPKFQTARPRRKDHRHSTTLSPKIHSAARGSEASNPNLLGSCLLFGIPEDRPNQFAVPEASVRHRSSSRLHWFCVGLPGLLRAHAQIGFGVCHFSCVFFVLLKYGFALADSSSSCRVLLASCFPRGFHAQKTSISLASCLFSLSG